VTGLQAVRRNAGPILAECRDALGSLAATYTQVPIARFGRKPEPPRTWPTLRTSTCRSD